MNISTATEELIKDYISSLAPSIAGLDAFNLYTGFSNEEKEGPAIIIAATNCTEDFQDSGIYRIKLSLILKDAAVSDANEYTELPDLTRVAEEILNSVLSNDLSTELIHVFDVIFDNQGTDTSGDAIEILNNLEVVAAFKTAIA